MKEEITNDFQRIVIYKINPNEQEFNGDVDFGRNVNGRILYGRFFIVDHSLVVENENGEIEGVFSLNHYYFLKGRD